MCIRFELGAVLTSKAMIVKNKRIFVRIVMQHGFSN